MDNKIFNEESLLRDYVENGRAMDYLIRNVEERDLEQILEIEKQSSLHPWSFKTFEDELKNINSLNRVLCRENGELISFIFCWLYGNELEIQNIATLPACRRRGYAKILLETTLKTACQKGAVKALLEVRVSNLEAIELYRQFGFEVRFLRKKYYSDQENALQMDCLLEENCF